LNEIHFADGIDTPDTVAFGRTAGQVAVVVAGLLSIYGIAHAPVHPSLKVPLASSILAATVALGWLRLGGRPSLDWAVFCTRYAVRAREGSFVVDCPAPPPRATTPVAPEAASAPSTPQRLAQQAASVVPLFPPGGATVRRPPRRMAFFSFKGGVGRTTLSLELASLLSARSHLRVALLDGDVTCPAVATRLGIPLRPGDGLQIEPPRRVLHRTGVQVLPWLEHSLCEDRDGSTLARLVESLDADDFDAVVIDAGRDLTPAVCAALALSDDVFVVITPTITGVADAYRSVAALRCLGLHDRLALIVNRARDGVDLAETITDLGVPVAAEIGDDPAVEQAENPRTLVGLDGNSPSASHIRDFAQRVAARVAT